MKHYCKTCKAPVEIKDGKIIRTCKCPDTTPVVADLSVTFKGKGGLKA